MKLQPNTDTRSRLRLLAITFCSLCAVIFTSCDIEETEEVIDTSTGSIAVSATTQGGDPILDAAIRLDGESTGLSTPDTLTGLEPGDYTITLFKFGYLEASEMVSVTANELSTASIALEVASGGTVVLESAPEGTVLLVDTSPVPAPVPPTPHNEFTNLGFGTFSVSAFLDGHATNLPARWEIELSELQPIVTITPGFSATTIGNQVGDLAPNFTLPNLSDSSDVTLADYRGRVVLVSFFFYQCAPCLIEFPEIQEVYEDPRFTDKIEFIAVDGVDPWPLFIRYLDDHPQLEHLSFEFLHDRTQSVRSNDYSVTAHPTNLLVDQTGVIRFRWGSVTEELLTDAILQLLAEAEN